MNDRPLPPRILQYVGLTMLIGFAVFWAITGKESALLVGAAIGLTLVARYQEARVVMTDAWRNATAPPAEEEFKRGAETQADEHTS